MTRKCSDTNFGNAVKDYLAGDSAVVSATRWHTSEQRLSNHLKAQGMFRNSTERREIKGRKISANSWNKITLPTVDIATAYTHGVSELALSFKYSVSRNVITRVLEEMGIERHTASEANSLRFERMTQEERNALVYKAQDAIRGKPAKIERLCKMAIARERIGFSISRAEIILADWLTAKGLNIVPQKAVYKYNIDIGIEGILGIEVFGGFWHASKPRHIERTRYLLNTGWNMLFIWNTDRSGFNISITDYIITFLDECRSNPAAPRQYRVLRGDGNLLSRGSIDDDNISVIAKGFKGGHIISKD